MRTWLVEIVPQEVRRFACKNREFVIGCDGMHVECGKRFKQWHCFQVDRMKFNVTFRCSLPIDFDKHPAGEELAEYLAARLSEQGLNFQHIDNHEDFAWALELNHRSPAPWLLVGCVGDDAYQWLVQIISGTYWFHRLFGRSDQELREAVAKKLHGILTTDPHFSDVRWHRGDFAKAGWTSSPVEPESTAEMN